MSKRIEQAIKKTDGDKSGGRESNIMLTRRNDDKSTCHVN